MWYRRIIALLAVVNAFVALYLHLWKKGLVGSLACGGGGGCMIAQMSSYGWFFGVDVALIGAVGYGTLFAVATVGGLERFADSRRVTQVLMALIYAAVLFTVRLKWAEFYKLRSFCPWCAISAVSITLLAVVVWMEWRRVRGAGGTPTA